MMVLTASLIVASSTLPVGLDNVPAVRSVSSRPTVAYRLQPDRLGEPFFRKLALIAFHRRGEPVTQIRTMATFRVDLDGRGRILGLVSAQGLSPSGDSYALLLTRTPRGGTFDSRTLLAEKGSVVESIKVFGDPYRPSVTLRVRNGGSVRTVTETASSQ